MPWIMNSTKHEFTSIVNRKSNVLHKIILADIFQEMLFKSGLSSQYNIPYENNPGGVARLCIYLLQLFAYHLFKSL